MSYTTKKALIKLLNDNNITTTAKTLTELVLIALDNEVVKREDVVPAKKPEKRPTGRPRKHPPKEVDPNKVIDPKYLRLRTIRTNPISVKLTNVDTGEITSYASQYKACRATHRDHGFFIRNNGKVVGGIMIEVIK